MATKQSKKADKQKSGAKSTPDKQLSAYEIDLTLATKLGAMVTRAGSHLTVKTFPDGHQELEWDDEALAKEVRDAIASVESK